MKRTINIIIKVIILLLIIEMTFIPISNAANYWDEIFSKGNEFLEEGQQQQQNSKGQTVIDEEKLQKLSSKLYSILFTFGVSLSVIVGAMMGIKLMCGSIEQKAKVKEMLIPYVIGCIVVFGAFGIWRIVITVLSNIN